MQRIEAIVFALLAAVGFWLHVPAVQGEFGRGFDGFQGAFFAAAAVNYERMGLEPSLGFPIVQIDPGEDPRLLYVYANHPRFVPQLAWWSLHAFGPGGWSDRPGPVPAGTETAVRAPFFALHVLCWLLVSAIAAVAAGRRAGLVALVLAVHVPLGYPFAGLVNYEHPSLVFVLAGALLALLVQRHPKRARALAVAAGAVCGAGALVTYAPVLFVPALALVAKTQRLALLIAGASTAALALLPHVLASRALDTQLGNDAPSILERVRTLIAPMFDGTLPPGRWLAVQWSASLSSFGPALVAAATLGIGFVIWRAVVTWRAPDRGQSSDSSSDVARGDSTRGASARSDSARSDSARGSARGDVARGDVARSDSARSDSARSDSARSDSARSDSARSDVARDRTTRTDSTHGPSKRSAPAHRSLDRNDLARAAMALALGALAVHVLYWKHTGDPQESFMLNAAPAVVLLATVAWIESTRLARGALIRGLVRLVPIALVAAGAARGHTLLHLDRAPGPSDLNGGTGPSAMLPRTAGDELADLLPSGVVGWYPSDLGWTPAVGFYAWRPLLPVNRGQYAQATSLAGALRLLGRPVWLILPREPSTPAMRIASDGLAADLAEALGGAPRWIEGEHLRAASIDP